MRYLIGLGAAVVLIGGFYYIVTLPSADEVGPARNDQPIKLGFVGPLTGDAAHYGAPIKNAVFLAVKDLKTQGKNIDVVYEDGRCSGDVAARAINKLVSVDAVRVVIGGVCSGETLGMAGVAEKEKVIVFSPAASSPDITIAGDFVFRNNPSDAYSGTVLGSALSGDYSSLAILSENTDVPQTFRRSLLQRFAEEGGEVVVDETVSRETNDFKPFMKKLKDSGAEALVINLQTERGAAAAVTAARKAGITVPLYGTNVLASAKFIEVAGVDSNGVVFIDLPPLDKDNPQIEAFLNDYEKFFGAPPATATERFYMAAAYDAVNILAQAIDRVGYVPEKIRDYLYNVPEYEGLLGKYSFDLNGDVVGISLVLDKINNGKIELYNEL